MTTAAGRVYPILDPDALASAGLLQVAALVAEAGVEWLQLRDKSSHDRQLLARARGVRAAAPSLKLWVNDRIDIALLAQAEGVHLGQDDLPARVAGELNEALLVGCSCHGDAQVEAAQRDPAVDVVAIGPVFATSSKANHSVPVGLEGVRTARSLTDKPLVAIGGIDADSAAEVIAAGADRVAIISALGSGSLLGVERLLGDIIGAIHRYHGEGR